MNPVSPGKGLRQPRRKGRITQAPPATTPIEEHQVEEAYNIPGRGVVDHGVPMPHVEFNPELDDDAFMENMITYDTEPKQPAPIPVYTVSGPGEGRVLHDFRTFYAAVGSQPLMIAGQHANRTKIKIYNRGSRTLFISDRQLPNLDQQGLPVPAGSSTELSTSRAVYGMISAYTPNSAPLTATTPADTSGWGAASNGTMARVTAPWNASRGAIQLTATATGYNVASPVMISTARAGQTLFYRFKIAWSTGTTPAMYIRAFDVSGAVTNLVAITAATITNTAGWIEITGSMVLPRDVSNLYYRIGSSAGASADVFSVGDLAAALDADPGTFYEGGSTLLDNQGVALYEEFDVMVHS